MKNNIFNNYGHCHYCVCKDNNCSMIYNLYIEKEYRRQGHAKQLVETAINEIRKTGYEGDIKIVAEPEEESIKKQDLIEFYEKMNLKIIDQNEIEGN